MIRLAAKEDKPSLRQIWAECFGDSEDYINLFFERRFLTVPTYVCEEQQEIVSMVTLIPGQVKSPEEHYKVQYVYALATKKTQQKKGYASKLLAYVVAHPMEKGALTILVPADNTLFSYYERQGFHTVGYKNTIVVSKEQLLNEKTSQVMISYAELTPETYYQLRQKAFRDIGYLEWDTASLSYLLEEYRYCQGTAVMANVEGISGILLFYLDSDSQTLFVKETTLPEPQLFMVLSELGQKYTFCQATIILPEYHKKQEYEKIERKPYVMIRSTNVVHFPYANLMKD